MKSLASQVGMITGILLLLLLRVHNMFLPALMLQGLQMLMHNCILIQNISCYLETTLRHLPCYNLRRRESYLLNVLIRGSKCLFSFVFKHFIFMLEAISISFLFFFKCFELGTFVIMVIICSFYQFSV